MKLACLLILFAASTTAIAQTYIAPLRPIMEVEYVATDYALGTGMLGLGDINQDGKPDFAVSAGNIEKTFIYFGGRGVLDNQPDIVIAGGFEMAKGDFNGDGRMDLIVSTQESLLVYYGRASTPTSSIALDTIPGLIITGEGVITFQRNSFALGDLNNDGFDDLVVTNMDYSLTRGKVYIFLGRPLPTSVPDFSVLGDTILSYYGNKAAVADINGDGIPDLAVSSDDRRGFATIDIYYGKTGWLFTKNGYDQRLDSREGNFYALSYFGLLDVNADGKADVSFGIGDTAYFFCGRSDSLSHTPDLTLFNPNTSFYGLFYESGFGIGDINRDGKPDFAMRLSPGGGGMCLVVYLGGPKPEPVAGRCKGFVNTSAAYFNITPLGDVNGDGVNDFGAVVPYNALGIPPQDGYFVVFNGDTTLVTSVRSTPPIPQQSYLSQNYPNPFNPSTTIEYTLLKSAQVLLIIYDATGKEIRKLVNQREGEGFHRVIWDGRRYDGGTVATGMYYYRLSLDGTPKETKQSLLIK